jgi:streptogramin lyase
MKRHAILLGARATTLVAGIAACSGGATELGEPNDAGADGSPDARPALDAGADGAHDSGPVNDDGGLDAMRDGADDAASDGAPDGADGSPDEDADALPDAEPMDAPIDAPVVDAGPPTHFTLPTPNSRPRGIAAGPDGNLWVTEEIGNKIARVTPTGTITEFALPTPQSYPWGITTGPDGNLWFTEYQGNQIGCITTAGVITEYPLPTAGSNPDDIASGADGNLWFTEYTGNAIGRITPSGVVTELPIQLATNPSEITSTSSGTLSFIGYSTFDHVTTAGVISLETLTTPKILTAVTSDPSGNVWFAGTSQGPGEGQVARVSPTNDWTYYPVPPLDGATHMTWGPDAKLWFVLESTDAVGWVTP